MIYIKSTFIFWVLLAVFTGCSDRKICTSPPAEFRLIINDAAGNNLFDPNFLNAEIRFYYKNGTSIYETPAEVQNYLNPTTNKTTYYLESFEAPWKSADNLKDFFVKIGDFPMDTLYLDVIEESEDGCSFFSYKSFKYQGRDITEKDNSTGAYLVRQ